MSITQLSAYRVAKLSNLMPKDKSAVVRLDTSVDWSRPLKVVVERRSGSNATGERNRELPCMSIKSGQNPVRFCSGGTHLTDLLLQTLSLLKLDPQVLLGRTAE